MATNCDDLITADSLRGRVPSPTSTEGFPESDWAGSSRSHAIEQADQILAGSFLFYSCQWKQIGFPPNWHTNPLSGEEIASDVHWSQLGDFAFGDIKHVWETARFSSGIALGRAYWLTRDERYAEGFWRLVDDWCENNLPNSGVHWKCGQETALRLMSILLATGFVKESPATTDERCDRVIRLAYVSAERIAANLSYALSQKNNHGISEAAGLYIIGLLFPEFSKAARWKTLGKQKLEQQILELIEEGGGFAQHSLNYQRLTLHVLILTLKLARDHNETFSKACTERIDQCAKLLASLCDPVSGHVSVLGPNDGALLLPLNACDYRDFRPVVQAASVLLHKRRTLVRGPWDEDLYWLGLSVDEPFDEEFEPPTTPNTNVATADGYLQMTARHSTGFMRCPQRLKFRPHHSDQLHFELWHDGVNILPDGGSFSYNDELMPYFRGVEAHNTVQFDERDQMPVLSRFLYGKWLNADVVDTVVDGTRRIEAGYTDYRGGLHRRIIEVPQDDYQQLADKDVWIVRDEISGFQRVATLRWRLNPKWQWTLTDNGCHCEQCRIEIESDTDVHLELKTGWVSWYYSQKESLPVLEVTTRQAATFISRIIITNS